MRLINSKTITALISLALWSGFQSPVIAQNKTQVEIGVLTCNVEGGVGYIFGSKKQMICEFKNASQNKLARYIGTITKFGLDIGYTSKTSITWAVFAPTQDVRDGDLAGSYGGVSAEATAGLGIGANILLGGLKESIALQPLSVQSQEGINVSAGITGLTLTLSK